MVFTDFLLGNQHERKNVEKKPACLVVVSLRKIFNGIPLLLCGNLALLVAQSKQRHASRA